MIRVGFSTVQNSILSRIIRWVTGSKVSHVWIAFDDSYFKTTMVMEAANSGFRIIPIDNFRAEGNEVVAIVDPSHSLDAGFREAVHWIGTPYDYGGLVGSAFVMLGRWLKRRWRNPFASSRYIFCPESIVRIMQISGYPGSESLDPSAVNPQDIMDFFVSSGSAPRRLARSKAFSRSAPEA